VGINQNRLLTTGKTAGAQTAKKCQTRQENDVSHFWTDCFGML
jgi:hypothetical protein